jgi:hypothetical protein
MMHEEGEQQNDRQRNPDQPKQNAFAECHVSLLERWCAGSEDHQENDQSDRHS